MSSSLQPAIIITSIAILLILLQHPATASDNFLAPLFSPITDEACKLVNCGKGKCKGSEDIPFFFECECDHGWKRAFSDDLKYLPCVIPNCTVDFDCSKASPSPPPPPPKPTNASRSIFDICHYTDCGGGFCNKTSTFSYKCECKEGYNNLLNISSFACFKECSLGMDCANLGFSVTNSTPPAPIAKDNGKINQAAGLMNRGANSWMWIILFMVQAIVM